MLISAGAAAAKMESSVDTQAVEHAVQNMASDSTTTRIFFIGSFSSTLCLEIELLTSG
jgi:2-methylcitrate dehydratase PrpD